MEDSIMLSNQEINFLKEVIKMKWILIINILLILMSVFSYQYQFVSADEKKG
jgi:hypothetical protein